MDIAILFIRVGVGATARRPRRSEAVRMFQGHGIAGTAGFLESLGFRPAKAYAWLLGGAELLGGLALAVALLTPWPPPWSGR